MGRHMRGRLFLAALALLAGVATANAASAMKTGGRTTQPIGHYDLCKRIPAECRERATDVSRAQMSKKLMRLLVAVNSNVNGAVEPKTDMQMWGIEEYWSYPTMLGDCEDYVLAKRRALIEAGLSPANALITVVRQPNGDGHAVLTVRTTGGDFILDNLDGRVLPWEHTPYSFLKRQSEKHSGAWLTINDGRADAVASVR